MSGAIERLIDTMPSGGPDELTVVAEKVVVSCQMVREARAELAALRAENARLREALDDLVRLANAAMREAGGYDRNGELEEARSLLSGTAPSTHRLVSLERLREIECACGPETDWCLACGAERPFMDDPGDWHAPGCWLGDACREEAK